MRQFFKRISIFIVIIYTFNICSLLVSAINPSVTVEAGPINDAKEFDAVFTISNNPGFAAFQVVVEFDPLFMHPVSVERGYTLYNGTMNTNIDTVLNDSKSGAVTIYFVSNENIVGDGELMKVHFRVSDNAVGTSSIKLTCKDGNFINKDYEELTIACTEGHITIEPPQNSVSTEETPTPPPVKTQTPIQNPSTSQPSSSSLPSSGSVNEKYVVSFETNGGSVIPSTTMNEGFVLEMPSVPSKDGFVFAGWYSDAELTQEYDFNAIVRKSFTLYAKWMKTVESALKWVNPFSDVQTGDWYYGDVEYVVTNRLLNGTSISTFAPNATTTRAMLVTVLWRFEGSPDASISPFADVPSGEWYSTAVAWAAGNGIVNGVGGDLFAPNVEITREQMAAILYRYEQCSGKRPPSSMTDRKFADWNSTNEYAKTAVNVLVTQDMIRGIPGNLFDPQGTAARAEVAAMLHRFVEVMNTL